MSKSTSRSQKGATRPRETRGAARAGRGRAVTYAEAVACIHELYAPEAPPLMMVCPRPGTDLEATDWSFLVEVARQSRDLLRGASAGGRTPNLRDRSV
jgi:hypothetical protein